jgi:hypothetical protein
MEQVEHRDLLVLLVQLVLQVHLEIQEQLVLQVHLEIQEQLVLLDLLE